jgi:predicted MPP superfamily phosphohydrolase
VATTGPPRLQGLVVKPPFRVISICLVLLLLSVVAYACGYEPYQISVTRVPIETNDWSPGLARVKVLHFSDLHFTGVGRREERLRTQINAENPDVIVFTGDLFNSRRAVLNQSLVHDALNFLATLRFRRGFFLVLGEEEYPFRYYLGQELAKIGATLLDDTFTTLDIDGQPLHLVGLTEDSKSLDSFFGLGRTGRTAFRQLQEMTQSAAVTPYRQYRTYLGGQYSLQWRNYDVTGNIGLPSGTGRFGLAVYSQLPMGVFRGYFLDVDLDERVASLTSAGEALRGQTHTVLPGGGDVRWQYRVSARTLDDQTTIRARLWPQGSPEPEDWPIDVVDRSGTRSRDGSVAIMLPPSESGPCDGRIRVTRVTRNRDVFDDLLHEGGEGVAASPVNDPLYVVGPGSLWMTLEELVAFVQIARESNTPRVLEAKLQHLLREAQKQPGFTLLLSHNPNVIRVAADKGIGLVVAGHTQGGQIRLPVLDRYIFDSFRGQQLDRGLKRFGGTRLYINRGIGMSRVPVRMGSMPELTVYEFKRGKA